MQHKREKLTIYSFIKNKNQDHIPRLQDFACHFCKVHSSGINLGKFSVALNDGLLSGTHIFGKIIKRSKRAVNVSYP